MHGCIIAALETQIYVNREKFVRDWNSSKAIVQKPEKRSTVHSST
jgi:hypothetical protein